MDHRDEPEEQRAWTTLRWFSNISKCSKCFCLFRPGSNYPAMPPESHKQHWKLECETEPTLIGRYFIVSLLCCLSNSRPICLGPVCPDRSAPGPVTDVTGRCLFNESSLEEVMKSALTPLTTRLISSRTHASAAFLLPAWGRCRHLTDRLYIS